MSFILPILFCKHIIWTSLQLVTLGAGERYSRFYGTGLREIFKSLSSLMVRGFWDLGILVAR